MNVISGAVPTFQGAPCWLVTSKDGRYAYTANAGPGTISGFTVGNDGSLTLLTPGGATASLGATAAPARRGGHEVTAATSTTSPTGCTGSPASRSARTAA